jgi:hypothetical protein
MEELEEKVRGAIEHLNMQGVKITKGGLLKDLRGASGNTWDTDIVLEKVAEGPRIGKDVGLALRSVKTKCLALIECKNVKSRLPGTYRTQLFRAYVELADLRNMGCPKFVVIPRRLATRFDYDSLFKSIQAGIVEWSNQRDREGFLRSIRSAIQ